MSFDQSIGKHLHALRIVSDARLSTPGHEPFASFLRYLPSVRKINLDTLVSRSARKSLHDANKAEPGLNTKQSGIHEMQLVLQSEQYRPKRIVDVKVVASRTANGSATCESSYREPFRNAVYFANSKAPVVFETSDSFHLKQTLAPLVRGLASAK